MQTNLSELFPYIAGILLSLLFSFVPVIKDWYEAQSGKKALIMLVVILAVALGYFGLGCTALAGTLGIAVPCSGDGAVLVALAVVKIVIGNQATYSLTKE